ncbi:beta-N-acetylhexosaminidase isoform X2 [Clupea harengus]|nr:beta-N-acetylhexosaminidase isoform X2 [Clupea harengus]
MLNQKAVKVFALCLFIWFIVRYLLRGSDRPEYVLRSSTGQFWGKDLALDEKSDVNALKPDGGENSGVPQANHKAEVEEMPNDLQAEVPSENKDAQRIVHLDLKGAAPKVKYLEQIFPLFASLGASGVLIEYEDMFPYDGDLSLLSSSFAYSVEDIMEINRLAKISNLEVIPLVQAFGHLEFVLKHEKYFGLREVAELPNSLNPRVPDSLALLKEMLTQVMKLHPQTQYFHIGCDEVYGLGTSQDSKTSDGELGKLYLSHVTAVGKFMTETWPSVKLLLWDDMLRKISVDTLKESGLPILVTPVVWKYLPQLDIKMISSWISRYEQAGFKRMWFASAFKGATGEDQMWTPLGAYLHNHGSWLEIISSLGNYPQITLEGIMLTGWQRYDHFSVLCELLPVAIPSLAVCLQTLKHGYFNEKAQAEVQHILGCKVKVDKDLCYGTGAFAGVELYHLVHTVHINFQTSMEDLLKNRHLRGGFSPYHRKYNFGNPRNLGFFQHKLTRTLKEWETVIGNLRSEMQSIYFPDTIEEWLEENVNPHLDRVREVLQDVQRVIQLRGRPKSQKLV